MATVEQSRATLDDLMRAGGKAELIGGRIVEFVASGRTPSRVAFRIAKALDSHSEANGDGEAFPDGIGYAVPELSSGRESFSPEASFLDGPVRGSMRFIDGPPTFAVEVRSENDYGPDADAEIAAKRDDYFEAGTRVVWDVDCRGEVIRSYRSDDPGQPTVFLRGQEAHAEPALTGWRVAVDRLFA